VNFTELFDKLPTSTLQDWETAARKQLKGKSLDSIHVRQSTGDHVAPYAIGSEPSILEGGSQDWIPFSSFLNTDQLSGADLLGALSEGSQGLELSFQSLKDISTEIQEVRFDFISLKVNGLNIEDQAELIGLIPEKQRTNSQLLLPIDSEVHLSDYELVGSDLGAVNFLLSPKLAVGSQESFSLVFDGLKKFFSTEGNIRLLASSRLSVGLEVLLSSNYLDNIIFTHALRLLFSNVMHSFGLSEPLPRPFLYGTICPTEDTASHEAYLINATAQAVAGVSGGLDALSIAAYSETDRHIASRRVRNIQNVLMIEGLLGLPVNAIKGAAYFESAAKDLVLSVWPDY